VPFDMGEDPLEALRVVFWHQNIHGPFPSQFRFDPTPAPRINPD
jgi:crotonobetainyl-CoA:carnitine CoA-transferase CaiB-like acyl-CoA transferase